MRHDVNSARYLIHLFRLYVDSDARLIGSLGKGKKVSDHDIDVLLPNSTLRDAGRIKKLLRAGKGERTDWGGIYFRHTFWGDVDVFFSHPTSHR